MSSIESVAALIDRRKLRRSLRLWRAAAFIAAALVVLAFGLRFIAARTLSGEHVARVEITGMITGREATLNMLQDLRTSSAGAVILRISSPGGTTEGSEALYDELRRLAEKKPVVAVVDGMAASGAYIAALGADRIFVRGNSIVGSIGVLMQYPNFSGFLEKVGVKYETIKSSPLKASPNGMEPTSDAAQAAIDALIQDSFVWFKDLVKSRRGLSDSELAAVADGRIFTGRQSLPLKLADEIGGEREALVWLETHRAIKKDLPIRDWKPVNADLDLNFFSRAADVADWFGTTALSAILRKGENLQGGRGRGLLAVWPGVLDN